MRDTRILYSGKKLASTIAVVASFVMIAGCATTGSKPSETAEAAPAAQPTAAEQLAADMNSKADARRQKADAGYRDPMVHSVNGTRQQIVAQQNQALYPGPATAAPPEGQSGIAGLVTQPTAVNANRSSIFAAPAPIAVNPDGTLASSQPGATAQGITPMMRSVYSASPTATQTDPTQSAPAAAPNGLTSADVLPVPVIRNAATPAASPQTAAQTAPAAAANTANPNVRVLNSKQAAILAQFVASKNQPQNGKLLVQPVQGAAGQ